MTIRAIRQVGDPILRTPAEPVRHFDATLRQLTEDMFETMYDAPGVGLAANQIGVGLRVFVYDCGPDAEDGPPRKGVVCNPRVTMLGGRPATDPGEPDWHDGDEGCLSVVGLSYLTPRWSSATVVGVDVTGAPLEITGHDLVARCLQHETDHLDGKLYLDRLAGTERAAARRALSA